MNDKKKIEQVTRALLGDIVPPPMTSPQGIASETVWVTTESGETYKGYFHINGYCYSRSNLQKPEIARWMKEATIGGGATREWREARPWVVSWSKDPPPHSSEPTKASRPRNTERLLQTLRSIRPRPRE